MYPHQRHGPLVGLLILHPVARVWRMRPAYISSMNYSPRSNPSTIFGNAFANQVNNSPRRPVALSRRSMDLVPLQDLAPAESPLLKRSLRGRRARRLKFH